MERIIKRHNTIQSYILDLNTRTKTASIGVILKNGSIKNYSSKDYFDQIQKVAKSLIDLDIKRGDKIAILSNTRHEWSVCDLATISIGAVTVPIYPNSASEELEYILKHSECKLVFADNRTTLRQLLLIKENCPQLSHIIVFDPPQQKEEGLWLSFNELISGFAHSNQHRSFNFEHLLKQANEDEIVTIIYTSGTTGQPKGVTIGHRQIINEAIETFSALQITHEDHTLTFLPYSHVLGRIEQWGHLIVGYQMTFSFGIEKLQQELPKIEPTVIVAVPRIFEKIYISLKTKIETSIVDSKIFAWAYPIGKSLSEKVQTQKALSLKEKSEDFLIKSALFDRLKKQLFGSKLRFAVSGGAPLSSEISQFFHACGILILEGYGLTETTGAVCVNRVYDFEFGTVGKPLFQATIKLSNDGEILIKSPTVFKEYYKDAKATHATMIDGWLKTGDIGEISKEGRIIIKDRKKDLIKTANGKYVAPQKIEGLFKMLPYISHVHVHGDLRSFVVALITLNKNEIFKIARENQISFKTLEDLKEIPFIKDLIRTGVAQVNLNLSPHETIKNYAVLAEDFSIESGEITPSLKVKRRIIDEKYKELINSLYL